jgi:secondary thiamine-phosphate synthase enzyme
MVVVEVVQNAPRAASPALPDAATQRLNGHANGHAAGSLTGPSDAVVHALPMRTLTRQITVQTERHLEFVDITDRVVHALAESEIQTGFAVVFSRHTTAGIRINEHEPLLLEDMVRLMEQLVPAEDTYRHDDFSVRTVNLAENERVNGHSHCRSLLLGASETIPVVAGRLLLGRWQRIFLVDLDGPNSRDLVVQLVGA